MTPPSTQADPKSEFIRVLSERGYIHQQSHAEELDAACETGRISAYVGFDATAASFHVGNLVSIMLLRRFAADGAQADRRHGRRHDQGGRSLW